MADSPSGPTPPSGHHRNGSVSRDPVPVRQTGREEEIASRALASHAQPFCNVQQMSFSEYMIIRYFCKRALLDVRYTSRIKSDPLEINRTFPIVSVFLQ